MLCVKHDVNIALRMIFAAMGFMRTTSVASDENVICPESLPIVFAHDLFRYQRVYWSKS